MKFNFKKQNIDKKSDIFNMLLSSGAEFAYELAKKYIPFNPEYKIIKKEVEGNPLLQNYFLFNEEGNEYFNIDGLFTCRFRNTHEICTGFKKDDNIITSEISLEELEKVLNKEKQTYAKEVLNDFFNVEKSFKVKDKFGDSYDLVIIKNADVTIGDGMIVDKLLLYKDNKEIGYLKVKYTTDEILKMYGEDPKSWERFNGIATIDYSKLIDDFTNKGLGYIMYFHMGQYLSEQGLKFRQSSICSTSAERLWEGMEKHFPDNIVKKKIGKNKSVEILKFFQIPKNCEMLFEKNNPKIEIRKNKL